VTKEYVLGVSDYSKATWTQNFIASVAGAVASITIAAPLDTIKTRIQNANFEHKVSGMTVVKDLFKNEGPMALFKGLTPKVGLFFLVCYPNVFMASSYVDLGRRTQTRIQLYAGAITNSRVWKIRLTVNFP
jgi:Mitochondrial carrier protein